MVQIAIGRTYLTKHGRFVKIINQPWEGVFNGDYEEDGRNEGVEGKFGRWMSDGKSWNFIFMVGDFYTPEHDIIMEDCDEARNIAEEMKLKRKQDAYDKTM